MDERSGNIGGTVLVTGAAGLLGSAVVPALLQEGYAVRAMIHGTTQLPPHPKMTVIRGSITDPTFVRAAVQGVQYIVHLAARKSDEKDSMEVNVEGAKNLVEAAQNTGVKRIMNISTQSVKLPRHGLYARSKEGADRVFTTGSVPVTTLYLSVIYADAASGIFGSLFSFARLPISPVIGRGNITFRPIHRDDAAKAILRLMQLEGAAGKAYDAGGPEVWTFDELLRECGKRIGKTKMMLLHIPIPVAMLIASACRILRHPPVTRSNVLGAAANVSMDTNAFFHDIGFTPRSVKEGLDAMNLHVGDSSSEAHALLRYVLPTKIKNFPAKEIIDRYERALNVHKIAPHHLDRAVLRSRILLGALDAATALFYKQCVLRQKLLIASAIMECTPLSTSSLLPKNRTVFNVVLVCISSAMSATFMLILGVLLLCFPSFFKRNAGC